MMLWVNGKHGLTSNTSDEDVLRDFIPFHLGAGEFLPGIFLFLLVGWLKQTLIVTGVH